MGAISQTLASEPSYCGLWIPSQSRPRLPLIRPNGTRRNIQRGMGEGGEEGWVFWEYFQGHSTSGRFINS